MHTTFTSSTLSLLIILKHNHQAWHFLSQYVQLRTIYGQAERRRVLVESHIKHTRCRLHSIWRKAVKAPQVENIAHTRPHTHPHIRQRRQQDCSAGNTGRACTSKWLKRISQDSEPKYTHAIRTSTDSPMMTKENLSTQSLNEVASAYNNSR